MNRTKLIALILAALIAAAVFLRFRIQNAVKNFNFGIAPGVKLDSFSFDKTTITIPIWINNPTGLNITISKLELELFINNIYCGSIFFNRAYVIKASSRSIIPFKYTVNNVNAMQVLIANAQFIGTNNWRDKLNIIVQGRVRAESGPIYLDNIPIYIDGTYQSWMN